MPGRVDTRWDNLEEFKKKRETLEKLNANNSQDQGGIEVPAGNLWGYVGLFVNHYFKKNLVSTGPSMGSTRNSNSKPDRTSYNKRSIVAIALFICLLSLSPKTRKWSKTLALVLVYLGTSGGLVYSLYTLYIARQIRSRERSGSMGSTAGGGKQDETTTMRLLTRQGSVSRFGREVSSTNLRKVDSESNLFDTDVNGSFRLETANLKGENLSRWLARK